MENELFTEFAAGNKMKSLLFLLVLTQIPSGAFGAITVHHKLTRELVLTSQQEFYPFNFVRTINKKGHLVISSPIDACTSINQPPKVDLHSVRKGAILQPNWILLADDTDCDVHYKIVQAQQQGFNSLIIYSNESSTPRPMSIQAHLTHLYDINVSFIGLKDGLELKKFAFSKPYVLTIERDWSIWVGAEDTFEYLTVCWDTFYGWMQLVPETTAKFSGRVRNTLGTIFQVLILTSPIWFLIGCSWKSYRRIVFGDNSGESWYRDNRGYRRYDDNSNSNEEDHNHYDTGDHKPQYNKYEEYRKLLGVSEDSTKAQVESAFRRKSATYHPDKNRHLLNEGRKKELEAKTEIFRKMNNAKDKLLELF